MAAVLILVTQLVALLSTTALLSVHGGRVLSMDVMPADNYFTSSIGSALAHQATKEEAGGASAPSEQTTAPAPSQVSEPPSSIISPTPTASPPAAEGQVGSVTSQAPAPTTSIPMHPHFPLFPLHPWPFYPHPIPQNYPINPFFHRPAQYHLPLQTSDQYNYPHTIFHSEEDEADVANVDDMKSFMPPHRFTGIPHIPPFLGRPHPLHPFHPIPHSIPAHGTSTAPSPSPSASPTSSTPGSEN
ncbi:hypothetical protein O6H91_18G081400 [Diphasiastrum complanatum]|uniref:Uncharacterized protein n=1 Tax=Diphasiastrum complanatum TaxID=34168 RepID=A0ACC2B455_DIPCM|nr:hypothetical protein O6H91_18G081400 [Diphasiastrum complanatum]